MTKKLKFVAGLTFVLLTLSLLRAPLRGQASTTPILLVVNSSGSNPFGSYLAEILRAEGIKSFTTMELSSVTSQVLDVTPLVLLAETPLTAGQAGLFRSYVDGGGRLIAMRPDAQIADVFGLIPQASVTSNAYISINQSQPIGAGLTAVTLPFKGTAANYLTVTGAASLATLYSDRDTPTTFPAVVRFNSTVAWSFDLARSVAYARQGDPANANVDTGQVPPLQSFDMFFTGFDAQRISVPFADIEMRLLARQITDLLANQLPLPQLWYYPSARRAMLLVAADAHSGANNAFERMLSSAESFGARVTLFISRFMPEPTPAQAANWRARGHEIALHPYGFGDGVSLQQGFQNALNWFTQAGLGTPSRTIRSHQIEWLGWADAAQIAANFGMGLDLNHYSFGPAVLQPNGQQGHGYITGSGRPMRFVTTSGSLIPVYGQPTVLIDHQLFGITIWSDTLTTSEALTISRDLIDAAVNEYHTVIPTQFHVDYYTWADVQPWEDGTMAYAQANDLPMWTGERWLRYNEARDATTISGTTWLTAQRQLQFTVNVPSGAEAQTVSVPASYAGSSLVDVRVGGVLVSLTTQTINSRSLSMFSVGPTPGGATVVASYGSVTPSLSVNDVSVVEGTGGTNSAVFTVTLSPASTNTVTVGFATADGTATSPADYTGGSGSLTFSPNVTTQVVTIPLVTDAAAEANETFTVVLSNPTNATIAKATGVGTIVNDDSTASALSINDVSSVEGNAGSTTVNLTVTLAPASAQTVTVNWATADGTAISGTDYTAASGNVTFAPGATSRTVQVAIIGDTEVEPDETFSVALNTPAGATIADGTGAVNILNDDAPPSGGSVTRTTRAEFICSVPTNAIVTQAGDGEVRLAGAFGDEFANAPLGPQWTFGAWTGGTYTPTVAGGILTIGNATGAFVRSTSTVNITTLETYAQFSAAPWEHLGWAGLDFADNQWLIFSTMGTSNTLFARTNTGGGEQMTNLGPIPSGYRDYRIERVPQGGNTDQIRYSIDGVVVATHTVTGLTPALYVYLSHNGGATPTLNADSLWVYPNHVPSGSLESCSIDAGSNVTWTSASWSASTPAGTTLGVRTRTSTDGTTFSAWSNALTVSGAAITSPGGRYLQYGLDLSSTNAAASPVVQSVTFAFGDTPSVPVLSIGNASVTEANVNAVFTVTLSAASAQTVTVNYGTSAGTAASDVDFTASSGTVTFAPGETSRPINVPVLDDLLDEADETFTVTLTTPVNATLGTATGTGTIVDNDGAPALSIGNASATEGSGDAVFTVTLTPASSQTVTVNYATASGSATSGADFTATNGTLTFAAGATSQTITVPVLNDTLAESTETFTITLTGPVNATLGTATGTGTINDNDGASLSIGNASATEGSGDAVFTVTLSPASTQTVTVNFGTAPGTATAPADFTTTTGTLTFAPGNTSQTISVPVVNDTLDEPDETFTVTLTTPVNATLGTATGTGTIVDNDGAPTLSIGNASVTEGSGNAVFTVTLSPASGQTVTVNYGTAAGTATAPADFTAASGTLTFAPGDTSRTISVTVVNDTINEPTETFSVTLTSPANATLGTATGTGTITDNDGTPTLNFANVSVSEGVASGTAVFTVTLSAASGQTVTVNFATANGTATAGADYTAVSGTLTFPPGTTSREITVPIINDTLDEANETFTVTLSSPVNATLPTATRTGTITDNDTTPSLTFANVTVTEGDTGSVDAVFTVTLSAVSAQTVTVDFATSNGTATAGQDYTARIGTLTFAPGTTSQTITVPVLGDTLDENDETYALRLSNAANASVPTATRTGTITDNDPLPSFSVSDVSVTEGNNGNVTAAFTITLSVPSGRTVSVNYATANGTAVAGQDYNAVNGSLSFTAGTTQRVVNVQVRGDTTVEPNETFFLNLSGASNATIVDGQGVGTILNND